MRVCCIVISFLFISVSYSANYYVNNATYDASDVWTTAVGNNANNGTSAATPKLTFRGLWSAYGPFADGDVIYVDAGTYTSSVGGALTQNYGYSITKNITIRGAGKTKTIFDNNYCGIAGNYYFADINGPTACVIRDIQFTKYSSNNDGQCFAITGSTVTFTNVIMNTNGGSSKYATIAINSNSTVTITGGGMYCNGDASHGASGGIDVKGTSITVNVTNVAYIGNYKNSSAQSGNGSACSVIPPSNNTTNVNFFNCLFSGCFVDNDNSIGTFYNNGGNLNLTDCIIDDSQAYNNSSKLGAAIYTTTGATTLTRVKVMNCSNGTGGTSTYGTVSNDGGSITLANCYFTGNTATRSNDLYSKGGTIVATNTYLGSAANQTAEYTSGSITLTNCGTPTNNYSAGTYTNNGGAVPAFTTPTVPTFTGACPTTIALPIQLESFEGKNKGKYNELTWKTVSEFNNDFFTVEKTTDGHSFFSIGNIKGAGNSNEEIKYVLNDEDVHDKLNYYRLRQTDFDGEFSYSHLISIDNRISYSKKEIISQVNILGQEINVNYRGLVITTFSDGTSMKTIQ